MIINPRCKVCRHKDRLKIDEAIIAGQTLASLSSKAGVSEASLHRHKTRHMDIQIITSSTLKAPIRVPVKEDTHMGNIAHRVGSLYLKSVRLMEKAEKGGNLSVAVAANKQALNCLEVYFKSSEVAYSLKKRIDAEESMAKLRGAVLEALAKFPEAKLAVARALEASQ